MSSTAELYKNREADMGNPNFNNFNIYHTIDEEKVSKSVEHLYDEIKHKNKDYGTSLLVGIATRLLCNNNKKILEKLVFTLSKFFCLL